MKKKIKDLTIFNLRTICENHDCFNCPFAKDDICMRFNDFIKLDLEQEVKVDE